MTKLRAKSLPKYFRWRMITRLLPLLAASCAGQVSPATCTETRNPVAVNLCHGAGHDGVVLACDSDPVVGEAVSLPDRGIRVWCCGG